MSFTLGSFSSFRHPILPFFHSMLEKSWLYTTSIAFFVDPRMVLVSDLISTLNYAYVIGFLLLRNPTGDVLIFAHRKGSTLTQYLTWFDKSPISTGESILFRDKERIQNKYMKKEDYFTLLYSQLKHTVAYGSNSSSSLHIFFTLLSFCSLIYVFIYRHP